MAAQIVNNRSACGIVEYDDGAGGVLSGGTLVCSHMDSVTSEFDHISVVNDLNILGTMTAANTTITPTWISYLYGLTGNIQTQINTMIGNHLGANNIWTGVNTFVNAVNFSGATIYGLTKVSVGLPNVDNTADSAKPISNAQASVNTATNNAIAANTANINSNTNNIATNTNNIASNTSNIASNTSNIATNTANINSNTSNIATNTADISTLQASYTIQSLAVGTTTTGEAGTMASVANVGSSVAQELRFTIPRGDKGDKGDRGSKGSDGSDGKDGSNGSNGSDGDSSAATISAGIAAGAAAGAVAAASAAAVSSASSAASAAAAAASAALNNVKVQELEIKLDALDLEVNQLDTDVSTLKQKTQNITATSISTSINSELQTNQVNCTGLYVAGDVIAVSDVKASNFTGGLLPTMISGSVVNIATNETLINTVTIGGPTTITTINGFVNFPGTNPFNNSFFAQW